MRADPHRHQLRFAVGVRAQQLLDRVDAVRRRAPRAVAAAGRRFAQGPPGVAAIGPRPLAGPLPCGLVGRHRWVERALGAGLGVGAGGRAGHQELSGGAALGRGATGGDGLPAQGE